MAQIFKHHRLCKQDGPLGLYIDPYAAEMRGERYSQQTTEKQIRVVVDFGRWLSKHGIQAQEITAELIQPYLRARDNGSFLQEDAVADRCRGGDRRLFAARTADCQ